MTTSPSCLLGLRKNYENLLTKTSNIIENISFNTKHRLFKCDSFSVSFPARKFKVELNFLMKTWDILNGTYRGVGVNLTPPLSRLLGLMNYQNLPIPNRFQVNLRQSHEVGTL